MLIYYNFPTQAALTILQTQTALHKAAEHVHGKMSGIEKVKAHGLDEQLKCRLAGTPTSSPS